MRPRPTILLALSDEVAAHIGAGLTKLGWDPILEKNGKNALEIIKSQAPGAVVAPLMLPDMAGPTFFRRIREAGNKTVLILIAKSVRSTSLRTDAGVDAVIDPSGELELLVKTLARFSSRIPGTSWNGSTTSWPGSSCPGSSICKASGRTPWRTRC